MNAGNSHIPRDTNSACFLLLLSNSRTLFVRLRGTVRVEHLCVAHAQLDSVDSTERANCVVVAARVSARVYTHTRAHAQTQHSFAGCARHWQTVGRQTKW